MLQDNWDGCGSRAEVLALLHTGAVERGVAWTDPHIACNERGEIVLEWWHGSRSLTVFVRSEDQVDYLKSWGSDIESEMEDGELSRLADFAALSRWLYRGDEQAT